jgi:hypothetical protein
MGSSEGTGLGSPRVRGFGQACVVNGLPRVILVSLEPRELPNVTKRVALGVAFAAPPFADNRATYVRLPAPVTFFQRVFQTRFLPFRFRDLRLILLRETSSM